MHTTFARLILLLSTLALAACSDRGGEAPPEPEAADKPAAASEPLREAAAHAHGMVDPTVADPDHYTAEFENDAVRIVRIKYGPGEESTMHYHPDSVAVFITDAEGSMIMPDGSTVEFSAPAGTASFNPGGAHEPRNTSDSAWEVVEVELKSRESEKGEPGGPDATVVDADHYTTEFENDAVRILRIKYEPGEESVMHYHPDSVAVFVTDHLVEMTMPDGSTTQIPAAAGDALFIPGGQHLPKNIADSAWELVLVELK